MEWIKSGRLVEQECRQTNRRQLWKTGLQDRMINSEKKKQKRSGWRENVESRRGGEKRYSQETASSTSRRQSINSALIIRRKQKIGSQRAFETFLCFYVIRWCKSRTTDKIRVGRLPLSAGEVDVIIYAISEVQRREGKKRKEEDRRQPKIFWLLKIRL